MIGLCLTGRPLSAQSNFFEVAGGYIHFTSDAPLELIEARSDQLKGLIDPEKNTFAFSVPMSSFEGFNSPLQKEHFNENYLESPKYPKATFAGKIIEDIDYSQDGEYTIRAKGRMNIHGVERERIIRSRLRIEDGKWTVSSEFTVLLQEHNITIPRIVYQKIAEEIKVVLEAEFQKQAP
jgi:polyisoprenoid-binding protein YceI